MLWWQVHAQALHFLKVSEYKRLLYSEEVSLTLKHCPYPKHVNAVSVQLRSNLRCTLAIVAKTKGNPPMSEICNERSVGVKSGARLDPMAALVLMLRLSRCVF